MKGMTAKVERTDWLSYPTENFILKITDWPTDRGFQEYLSNYPTVLLHNGRGVERIGKRGVERNTSGKCIRAERK